MSSHKVLLPALRKETEIMSSAVYSKSKIIEMDSSIGII